MIKSELIIKLEPILSNKEIEVVLKRLNNKHITQTESNYLSRSIRPKLKSAEFAVSLKLPSLLDYRRKKYERDYYILRKKIIGASKNLINNIKAVIIYGSYIRNHHADYRDIDIMIILKKRIWKTSSQKHKLEVNTENSMDIGADVNLISYADLISTLPYSPLLQTELEDYKLIYGNIKLKKKIIINKAHLQRRLLETEYVMELGKTIKPRYIYNAIRNCLSIELFLKKIVDNKLIIETIENNIGKLTAQNLLNNKANSAQRDIALKYLNYLYGNLTKILT